MSTAAARIEANVVGGDSLPALVRRLDERGLRRFLEFFVVHIRNANTRSAYGRAAGRFLHWCEQQNIAHLDQVGSFHVAAYVQSLESICSKPTVKQHLACIRQLFDWLIVGQVVSANPASAVRGPKHSIAIGKTPVLSAEETRILLNKIDVTTVSGLRDRALIALMAYSFARIEAAVSMRVEDFYPEKRRWKVRLMEKNGKVNVMPCHHNLEHYMHEYIEFANLSKDPKGWLFRAVAGRTGSLTDRPLHRSNAWQMVRKRAKEAGIATAIGNHTFRATGITEYLRNGGRIEIAQRMAGHSDSRTTKLYDRRADEISLDEIERIII